MADRYLDSGAASSAQPYDTTASAALSAMAFDVGVITTNLAVNETIWAKNTHSFSTTVAQLLTSSPNATADAPQRMICVSDFGTNSAPVAVPTAVEQSSVNGAGMGIEGFWVIHGMIFANSSTGNSGRVEIGATGGGPHNITLDTCQIGGSAGASSIGVYLGAGGSSGNDETQISLANCVFKPRSVVNKFILRHGQHRISNLTVNTTEAVPTTLFASSNAITFDMLVENCDLSNVAMTNFFSPAGAACGVLFARNIRLAAGVVLCTDEITAPGLRFVARDITIGTTYVPFYSRVYAGEVIHETTILPATESDRLTLRDDASEPYTMRLVLNHGSYWQPLYSDWLNINVEDLATPLTPFVEILVAGDGAAALTDREVWMEVDVKNVAGTNNQTATRLTDGAGIVAAGTAQAAGTMAWTGHGYTTPRTHRLALGAAITPTQKGFIRVRVALAKVGTIYIGKGGVA